MENDIVTAPAGYMFMYVSALAVFAWNFYRILRNRTQSVRIETQGSQQSNHEAQDSQRDYQDSRRAA